MDPIKISPGEVPTKDRRPSPSEAFAIVKSEPDLRVYEDLASNFSARSILVLGIFRGGSHVFLDNPPDSNLRDYGRRNQQHLIRKAKSAVRRADVSQNLENGSHPEAIILVIGSRQINRGRT